MKPEAPPGHFKNGSAFVDPQEYCDGARDGLTKAEYVEARRPAPVPPPIRKCTVCRHPEKARIEALRVSGVSLEALAEQFGLGRDAVFRHCKSHMTAETKASYLLGAAQISSLAEQAAKEGRSVLDYLTIIRSILTNQLVREAELNRPYVIERIAARLIDVLKEIGGHTGEVQRLAGTVFNINQTNVSILNSPEFTTLQQGLLEVCHKHPEARADIIALFRDLDSRHAEPATKMIEAKVMEAAQ